MKEFVKAAVVAVPVVAALSGAFIIGQHRQDSRVIEISAISVTPTPQFFKTTSYHELICQEDEDIVITLGENGLPYAFCKQVIER